MAQRTTKVTIPPPLEGGRGWLLKTQTMTDISQHLTGLKADLAAKKLIYLRIRAVPKSATTEFTEILADGSIKLRVRGAAEKGKANSEVCDFLQKFFGASEVVITAGTSDRVKLVRIKQ